MSFSPTSVVVSEDGWLLYGIWLASPARTGRCYHV